MKKTIIIIFTILICLPSFFSCKKDNNEAIEELASSATFKDNTSLTLPWDTETITVEIEWSNTLWKLAKSSGDIIESVSVEQGGDKNIANGHTSVEIKLHPNTGSSERSQELLLTNFTSKKISKLKITQQITNVGVKITLDPTTLYQKITGFGGMLNPSWTGNNLTDADVQKLYGDLGYSIIRMMLYPNQTDWGLNTATAIKAQSLGAKVFASPWTPPASMKSNGITSNADGGYLLPEHYPDFAAHLKAFVDYQKNKGLNIYAVSVQNEPNWKVDYDGCSWSASQMLNFVKNYGNQVGTKLIAAEAVNNYDKSYTNGILNDAVAVNNIDIVATHLYGGGLKIDALAAQKGKEFWMTEHCITDTDVNDTIPSVNWTLDASLDIFATEINDCMQKNMNAYVWWYLKRYYSMIADNDSRNLVASGEVTKRGYIMGHYAKYATGKTRIKNTIQQVISLPKDVLSSAYYGNSEITMVIINRNDKAFRIEIASPSEVSSASAVETTEAKNMAEISTDVSTDKKSIKIGLSANSIISVRLKLL